MDESPSRVSAPTNVYISGAYSPTTVHRVVLKESYAVRKEEVRGDIVNPKLSQQCPVKDKRLTLLN